MSDLLDSELGKKTEEDNSGTLISSPNSPEESASNGIETKKPEEEVAGAKVEDKEEDSKKENVTDNSDSIKEVTLEKSEASEKTITDTSEGSKENTFSDKSEGSKEISTAEKPEVTPSDTDTPIPRSKRRKSSSLLQEPESLDKITNKDVSTKSPLRTRTRSRSKSSNSEDLKPPSVSETCEEAPEVNSTVEPATSEAPLKVSPGETDEPMEVDSAEAEDSGTGETVPLTGEDDASSDFAGFDEPEDKYTAFSVVLRPYEATSTISKRGSQNGLLNSIPKHLSITSRLTPVRSSPSNKIDTSDAEYRKPFDYGWKRELVFRSTNETSLKRNADVYYYTPTNKKVRSLREVLEHIKPGEGLTADNFTFCKEPLGVDDPEKEVIREAKWKPNRPSEEGFYTVPVKKATPKVKSSSKPKDKKDSFQEVIELSPSSSPSASTSSPLTPRIVMKTNPGLKINSKKTNLKAEKRRKAAGPDDSMSFPPHVDSMDDDWCAEPKAQVREVCSIECRLAMGLIPTLQCVRCLCLYHPECVNLPEAKERQIHSYVCKYCQNDAKAQATSKLPSPPPLTPIVNPPVQKRDKEKDVKAVAPTVVLTTPALARSQAVVGAVTTSGPARSQAIVGAVTTWLPPASSIIKGPVTPRPELESSPQSLISVHGKKYVVIPKVNRVKLDGREGEEQQPQPNPAGVCLVPFTPNSTKPYLVPVDSAPTSLTNGLKRGGSDSGSGSDGSPPAKISAVAPKSSSSAKTVGAPKPAPKGLPTPKQSEAKSSQPPTVIPPTDFMNLFNAGYIGLLHAFQYLKVHELLRAACVCKMWRHMATHRSLWETVKMKNSRVRNWEGFGRSLRTYGTKCLDLKKMLLPDGSEAVGEMWKNLVSALKTVPTLTKIDMGRCSPDNLEMVAKACPQLESIVALSIRGANLDLNVFKGEALVELKLKSVSGMDLSNFSALKKLNNLKHLSLTSIKKLVGLENALPPSLESLELGECCHMSESFGAALSKLKALSRLRLEKGQGTQCPTHALINSVASLENLAQLELINFDIKPGFDKALAKCVHVKTLLIIPTYVTQSATTNHVVMGGVTKLAATLEYFIWGLTLELLRVTDLFIDQVEGQKQKAQAKKGTGDSIPILKPLSDENAEPSREGQTTSQVDILALPKLQKVLSTLLPTTRIKILKVPFSATWRQTVD